MGPYRKFRLIGLWSVAIGLVALLPVAGSFAQTVSFGPATNFAAGDGPVFVAIGDLNRDGNPDLAVTNAGTNTVSVLLGNGTGSFGTLKTFAVGNVPISVAIGDLNRDGNPDLAVTNKFSDTVSILLGDGTGSFSPATNSPFAVGDFPLSLAIGDLDGDGKPDLAVANAISDIECRISKGTTTLSGPW